MSEQDFSQPEGSNCETVRELLYGFFDEQLSETADGLVRRHLDLCKGCTDELMQIKDTVNAIQSLPREATPARVLWPPQVARRATVWKKPMLLAAALAGLILVPGIAAIAGLRLLRSIDDEVGQYTYESVGRGNVIVELIGLGDDETVARSFTLTRPIDVNVFALGEGGVNVFGLGEGQGGDMFDYGWIMDARTREIVWRMDYDDTDHAGGAAKNRVIDEVIRLDSGSYTVYFVTDGSHSYEEWNSGQPIDGELWGITLSGVGDGFDMSAVTAYEPASDPAIIAQLVEIRDDERRRTRFTLDQDTEVRIYALGEGSNDMFDYGWIEAAGSGRVVWEMTYRSTDHAGGAEKNRRFNGTMSLPSGDYILRYESDGSHSFGDWNDDPPDDPAGWGVTIMDALGDAMADIRVQEDRFSGLALDALIAALQDPDAEVRRWAALGLGDLGDAAAVDPLLEVLANDSDGEVRRWAAWALGEIQDESAVGGLIHAVTDDDHHEARRWAAWALGEIQDEGAVRALGEALGDDSHEVRRWAAWALGEIADSRAVEPLSRAVANDDHHEVRRWAAWALGEIADPRAAEALIAAMEDESAEVRRWAIWALGEIER